MSYFSLKTNENHLNKFRTRTTMRHHENDIKIMRYTVFVVKKDFELNSNLVTYVIFFSYERAVMSGKVRHARNQSAGIVRCFVPTDQTAFYREQLIAQKLLWNIVREETVETLPAEVVSVLTAVVVVAVLVVQLAAADAKVFVAVVVAVVVVVVSTAAPDMPEKTAKNTERAFSAERLYLNIHQLYQKNLLIKFK